MGSLKRVQLSPKASSLSLPETVVCLLDQYFCGHGWYKKFKTVYETLNTTGTGKVGRTF